MHMNPPSPTPPEEDSILNQLPCEPSELASNGYNYHIESWSRLWRQDYLFEIPSRYLASCRVIKSSYKSELWFASWVFFCSPSKLFWYYFSLLFIHDRDQLVGAEFVRVTCLSSYTTTRANLLNQDPAESAPRAQMKERQGPERRSPPENCASGYPNGPDPNFFLSFVPETRAEKLYYPKYFYFIWVFSAARCRADGVHIETVSEQYLDASFVCSLLVRCYHKFDFVFYMV